MSNEIDLLMDLDPLELTKDPKALDAIIAYHRQRRAEREGGGKGKRAVKDTGPKLALGDLVKGMVKDLPPAGPIVKRRI